MDLEPIITQTNTESTQIPKESIPEVVLKQPEIKTEEQPIRIVPIEKISQLLMFQSGNASTAPTHSPRNFYEQIVIKDSGSVRKLWILVQKDGVWRNATFT